MARYRKVDTRIWNDAKFRRLSDDGQLAFLFSLTHPHMTAIGAMRATISGLAAEKGWPVERFDKAIREVIGIGMALVDEESSCLALPNFLKYNSPANPNVVMAWRDSFDLIPEGELKLKIIQRAKAFVEGMDEGFREAFVKALGNGSGNGLGNHLGNGCPNQEQEQEQKQEQKQDIDDVCSERSPKNGDHSKPTDSSGKNRRHASRAGSVPVHRGSRPATHGTGAVVATIPLADGTEASVTDDIVAEWRKAFPGVNIEDQLKRIRVYFLTNPTKRKTVAGIGRCITSWLAREQDGGGGAMRGDFSGRRDTVRSRATDYAPPVQPGKYAGIETVIRTTDGAVLYEPKENRR